MTLQNLRYSFYSNKGISWHLFLRPGICSSAKAHGQMEISSICFLLHVRSRTMLRPNWKGGTRLYLGYKKIYRLSQWIEFYCGNRPQTSNSVAQYKATQQPTMRFRVHIDRFDFNIFYVPGKHLCTADTLSWSLVTEAGPNSVAFENGLESFVKSVVNTFPASNRGLQAYREAQTLKGWPDKKQLSPELRSSKNLPRMCQKCTSTNSTSPLLQYPWQKVASDLLRCYYGPLKVLGSAGNSKGEFVETESSEWRNKCC